MSLHEQLAHALRCHAIEVAVNTNDFDSYFDLVDAHFTARDTEVADRT